LKELPGFLGPGPGVTIEATLDHGPLGRVGARGYSDQQIEGILGENFLHVFEAVSG
jgi:hypothetical protein